MSFAPISGPSTLLAAVLVASMGCVPVAVPAGDRMDHSVSDGPRVNTGRTTLPSPGIGVIARERGVSGRVVSRTGRPLGGIFVQAAPAGGGGGAVPEMAVFTGNDGHFHYPVPAGRYVLTFLRNGTVIASRTVRVPRGGGVSIEVVAD